MNYGATIAEHFCDSFRDKLQWLISRAAERSLCESGTSLLQPRVIEVVQHLTMCRDRSHEFKGRDDVLRVIRDYLKLPQQQQQQLQQPRLQDDHSITGQVVPSRTRPLVLCGESGSGKTSVMAKVRPSFSNRSVYISYSIDSSLPNYEKQNAWPAIADE